jgi:hypothetical protein
VGRPISRDRQRLFRLICFSFFSLTEHPDQPGFSFKKQNLKKNQTENSSDSEKNYIRKIFNFLKIKIQKCSNPKNVQILKYSSLENDQI